MKQATKTVIVMMGLLASMEVFAATVKEGDRAYSEVEAPVRTIRPDGKIELVATMLGAGTIVSVAANGTAQFQTDPRADGKTSQIMLMKSDIAKLKRPAVCPALTEKLAYSTTQFFNQASEDKKLTDIGFVSVKEVFGDCKTGIAVIEGQFGTPRQIPAASLLSETSCTF